MPRTIRFLTIALLITAITSLAADATVSGHVTFDHYVGATGISIVADDSHYCSIEFPNGASCEEAH
jgi:hypothetical protein